VVADWVLFENLFTAEVAENNKDGYWLLELNNQRRADTPPPNVAAHYCWMNFSAFSAHSAVKCFSRTSSDLTELSGAKRTCRNSATLDCRRLPLEARAIRRFAARLLSQTPARCV